MAKKGFIEGIGVAELINVAVANGETTKTVEVDDRSNGNYIVFTSADYAASEIVSAKTRSGFTLTFTDPTADKNISCLIIG
jgi:type IV secretory pathway ATPase VirB11/archaellum biosynthesis ATPase